MARDEYKADDYYFAAGRIVLGLIGTLYYLHESEVRNLGLVQLDLPSWILPLLFAITGALVWCGPFAGRLASVVFSVLLLVLFFPLALQGRPVALLLMIAMPWSIWTDWPWRRRTNSPDKPERDSLPSCECVLLLREPAQLDRTQLAQLAAAAWRVPFIAEATPSNAPNSVVGEPPLLLVKFGTLLFSVQAFDEPYFKNVPANADLAGLSSKPKLQQALTEHQAWLCVEFLSGTDHTAAQVNDLLRALVNQLLGENVLAIYLVEAAELTLPDRSVQGHVAPPPDEVD